MIPWTTAVTDLRGIGESNLYLTQVACNAVVSLTNDWFRKPLPENEWNITSTEIRPGKFFM